MTVDFPKFKLENKGLSYASKVVMMGSCFTEHIGNRLQNLKFSASVNPLGIAYDPLSLVRHIENAFTGYKNPKKFLNREGLHLHYDYHSKLHGLSLDELNDVIQEAQNNLAKSLQEADFLFITLGSAFAYKHLLSHDYVCNCHKTPQKEFKKELLGIAEMAKELYRAIDELQLLNPKLQIILTVSPVKHLKDGLIENVRSKARLIELAHQTQERYTNVQYYPVFEMVQECLRDYRYYAEDLAHPNELAQKLVFEAFKKDFCLPETLEQVERTEHLMRQVQHKSLHPKAASHQAFLKNLMIELKQHAQNYPSQDWSTEMEQVLASLE